MTLFCRPYNWPALSRSSILPLRPRDLPNFFRSRSASKTRRSSAPLLHKMPLKQFLRTRHPTGVSFQHFQRLQIAVGNNHSISSRNIGTDAVTSLPEQGTEI